MMSSLLSFGVSENRMKNRTSAPLVGCLVMAVPFLWVAGCTTSSSRDWAQMAPIIAPTSVSVDQVHLGVWRDSDLADD